jgi:hypothetical protein
MAITPLVSGDILTSARLNLQQPIVIRKQQAQPVVSSETYIADAEFFVHLEANTAYFIEVNLVYTGNASGDIRIDWNVPPNSTQQTRLHTGYPSTTTSSINGEAVMQGASWDDPRIFGATSGNCFVRLEGTLTTGDAGVMRLMWAQGTSHATPTQVLPGSWISVRKY